MEKQYEEDEIQIDLLELFYEWKRRIWVIILAAVLGGGAAGAYSTLVIVPQYTSTATVYVLSKETTLTSLADLQIGSQLTKDYTIIITSRPVLQNVIDQLNLDIGYRQLQKKIKISNPSDTRILALSVTDSDPYAARDIANSIAVTSANYIGDIMEMTPPKMIEEGEVPLTKTSPSAKKNTALGAIAGIILVCGIIAVRLILNDSIKTEEDIERYLGVSSLAVVPERNDGGGGQKAEYKEPKKRGSKRGKKRGG